MLAFIELGLKSRDKMLAAMTGRLKGDFPVVVPYLDIFLRDHWDKATRQPWWASYDLKLRLKVEEDLRAKLGPDWVHCEICHSREWRENHKVETRGNVAFLMDTLTGTGKKIQREPVSGFHSPIGKEPLVKSLKDVEEYVDGIDEGTLIQSGSLDYAKMVVERFGSEKFVYASIGTPYLTALTSYFGFKAMMINLIRRPELVADSIKRIWESQIEYVKAYAKVGVDGIWVEEALSSATEISPTLFKRFCLPYTADLIREVSRAGMKSVYYMCGDVSDRLELIVESGAHCISLEESKKGFETDIAWVNEVVAGRAYLRQSRRHKDPPERHVC